MKVRKAIIVVAVFVLLLAGTVFILREISNSRTFQFFGEVVSRVETDKKVIAITFDDGPTPGFTDEVLEILRRENVKASFFLIGSEIEKHLDEAKKINAAGHEIGNHSFSHTRMIMVSPSFVQSEIKKTDDLIRAAGYNEPTHFRPPYGKKLFALPWYLSSHHRKTITWDVEPESYPNIAKDTRAIVEHVLAKARNGSIVLLHVMNDRERKSMRAVEPIVKGLKERGFQFVTVSELLR